MDKQSLIMEIARLHKGMTVVEFARKYGRLTKEQLERRVCLEKAVWKQVGELV
jgi:hypothetical protein